MLSSTPFSFSLVPVYLNDPKPCPSLPVSLREKNPRFLKETIRLHEHIIEMRELLWLLGQLPHACLHILRVVVVLLFVETVLLLQFLQCVLQLGKLLLSLTTINALISNILKSGELE